MSITIQHPPLVGFYYAEVLSYGDRRRGGAELKVKLISNNELNGKVVTSLAWSSDGRFECLQSRTKCLVFIVEIAEGKRGFRKINSICKMGFMISLVRQLKRLDGCGLTCLGKYKTCKVRQKHSCLVNDYCKELDYVPIERTEEWLEFYSGQDFSYLDHKYGLKRESNTECCNAENAGVCASGAEDSAEGKKDGAE